MIIEGNKLGSKFKSFPKVINSYIYMYTSTENDFQSSQYFDSSYPGCIIFL